MTKPKYTFEIYGGSGKGFYWRLIHRNGRIVADGGESYKRKGTLVRSLKRIVDGIQGGSFQFKYRE